MTDVNPLTQPGGIGPDQSTRQCTAEHEGGYAHRPAPHMEPAPVMPPGHLAHLAALADESGTETDQAE